MGMLCIVVVLLGILSVPAHAEDLCVCVLSFGLDPLELVGRRLVRGWSIALRITSRIFLKGCATKVEVDVLGGDPQQGVQQQVHQSA
jgi:hypothetical protein